MHSRLLDELNRQAREAKSRVDWSIALCRIAIYISRQGNHTAATQKILEIRKHYGVELHHEVASWVMLAEGVIHFSKGEMKPSFERIRRAHALSGALRTESVRGACAAWMALLAFNSGRYDDMVVNLQEAFEYSQEPDHQAQARASLVLADAYQVAGSFEMARPWYEKARRHASIEGDQSTLSAYLYNVAVFRTSNLRLADAFDEVNAPELSRASLEANSSFTYDMMMGSFAFGTLWKILHAQLLIIRREYSEATILLNSIRIEELAGRDIPIFHADLALCYWNLGRSKEAANQCALSEASLINLIEPDDKAYVLKRLAGLAGCFERPEHSEDLQLQASSALDAHRSTQAALMEKLSRFKFQKP